MAPPPPIRKSLKRIFSDGAPKWDKAVSSFEFKELADELATALPEAQGTARITKNNAFFDDLYEPAHGNIFGSNKLIGQPYSVVLLDGFFSDSMATALRTLKWSDKHIGQLAVLHELAHGAMITRANAHGAFAFHGSDLKWHWQAGFSCWPLSNTLGSPSTKIKQHSETIAECFPGGDLAGLIDSAQRPSDAWLAYNLEELRADAISIAVCSTSKLALLSDHPLRVNFKAALDQIEAARKTSGEAYRWGGFSLLIKRVKATNVLDLTTAIAMGECAALAAANENISYFASQQSCLPAFSARLNALFPNPMALGHQQFISCQNVIDQAFPKQIKTRNQAITNPRKRAVLPPPDSHS